MKGPGKGVYFRQVQGYVFANPRQHDILGRSDTELVDIVTNTFQREGIIVRCPAGPAGKSFDLLLTFYEIFFYSMCVFLQADLPYTALSGDRRFKFKAVSTSRNFSYTTTSRKQVSIEPCSLMLYSNGERWSPRLLLFHSNRSY